MGLLDGKHIIVTGVLTDASLAFGVAKLGAGGGGRRGAHRRRARAVAHRADGPQAARSPLGVRARRHGAGAPRRACATPSPSSGTRVDGVLHSIGFAARRASATTSWARSGTTSSVALHVSAYSLKALVDAFVPLMAAGGSFVGLDFDTAVAWPAYNWMGVAKSALESTARYLAHELGPQGIRCNLVAAGPVKTMAAKSIPGFKPFEDVAGAGAAGLVDHRRRAGRPGVRRPASRTGSRRRPAR